MTKAVSIFLVVSTLIFARPAKAQSTFQSSSGENAALLEMKGQQYLARAQQLGYRSPQTAFRLTFGWYGAGALLFGTGLFMELSSDDDKVSYNPVDGVLVGGIGLVAMTAAPVIGYSYADETLKGTSLSLLSVGGMLLWGNGHKNNIAWKRSAGVAINLGVAIYSLIDSPKAARRTNRRIHRAVVAPTVVGENIGLGIAGVF